MTPANVVTNPGTLAVGGSSTSVINAAVDSAVPGGSFLTNRADVSSPTLDPNLTNNIDSCMTPVNTGADFALTKVCPAISVAGVPLAYTDHRNQPRPRREPGDVDGDGDFDAVFADVPGLGLNEVWINEAVCTPLVCGDCDGDGDGDILDALRTSYLSYDVLDHLFRDDSIPLFSQVTPVNVSGQVGMIKQSAQIAKGVQPACPIPNRGIDRRKEGLEVDVINVNLFFIRREYFLGKDHGLPVEERSESIGFSERPDDTNIGHIDFGNMAGKLRAITNRALRLPRRAWP